MIRLTAAGIPLKIHPLLPILLLLSAHMGSPAEALSYLPALLLHESAHLLAARICAIRVEEMELTPLGAAIRLKSPWNASAARIILTALAGPAANFLLILLLSTFAWQGILMPHAARTLLEPNLLLFLCNLIPALPMDGGRALCAALSRKTGVQKAVRIFTGLGYMLSAALAAIAIGQGIARGIWNIALIAAAAYIAACASRETAAAACASAETILFRADELRRRESLPVHISAARCDIPLSRAVSMLRPGSVGVLLLYDEAMQPVAQVHETDLLRLFPAHADAPLHTLLTKLPQKQTKFLQMP